MALRLQPQPPSAPGTRTGALRSITAEKATVPFMGPLRHAPSGRRLAVFSAPRYRLTVFSRMLPRTATRNMARECDSA